MKLNVFISSRNLDRVIIKGTAGDTLTEIRKHIKTTLEAIRPFGKDFLEIEINEDFAADGSTDSYNTCLRKARASDFLIAIYSGSAGWAPTGIDMGICHAELHEVLSISRRKIAFIDVSGYFNLKTTDASEKKRNKSFETYIKEENLFTNPLKIAVINETKDGFKLELLNTVKAAIDKHLSSRIELSNHYYNIRGNNKISLDWKKLKYSDRDHNIRHKLKGLIDSSPDFKDFESGCSSIPDNMSVEDAKAFTGRPFLKDQETIKPSKKGPKRYGPIHFIGVFGNATEIQVKNLIGFPDISAISDDFGLYVWEQNTHVQLVFLTECATPSSIKSKFLLFTNWCNSNRELVNIEKRAKARYHILESIIEAKIIAN